MSVIVMIATDQRLVELCLSDVGLEFDVLGMAHVVVRVDLDLRKKNK